MNADRKAGLAVGPANGGEQWDLHSRAPVSIMSSDVHRLLLLFSDHAPLPLGFEAF